MMMIVCNICKEEESDILPFQVPNDPVGIALMQQHLLAEHGIEPNWKSVMNGATEA